MVLDDKGFGESGLPPGSQKSYRVQNNPKIPIKCQSKIPSIWQITDKNTDTKEGESKQQCGSCKRHICTTGGQKQQHMAKLYSLGVNFQQSKAMSLH